MKSKNILNEKDQDSGEDMEVPHPNNEILFIVNPNLFFTDLATILAGSFRHNPCAQIRLIY